MPAIALAACQNEPDARVEQIYDEELAKVHGEKWPNINTDNFSQLDMGSSYEDAVALLSPGEEVSRVETADQSTVTYQWVRPDGGNINLTFSNGGLVSKAQAGLYHP